jgi:hypothetical protein
MPKLMHDDVAASCTADSNVSMDASWQISRRAVLGHRLYCLLRRNVMNLTHYDLATTLTTSSSAC